MSDEESYGNTIALGLSLAIGGQYVPKQDDQHKHKHAAADLSLDHSFTLCSKDSDYDRKACISRSTDEDDEHAFIGNRSDPTRFNNGRKKLRLTKEQYSFLEDSFKSHSTLSPAQKHALAETLDLKPRQVEVWFQNRRARSKLKQTEIDYEYLKKCCQDLSDENGRLKKELQELRALEAGNFPVFTQPPKHAATLAMCPSCENNGKGL